MLVQSQWCPLVTRSFSCHLIQVINMFLRGWISGWSPGKHKWDWKASFGARSAGTCIHSKKCGTNEGPSTHQCQHFHTSHGDTNSSTWRIHAQGTFFWRPELWLPQSLGSTLQLCNRCPQALETTKSPACCEEPWLSRDQESRLPHCLQDKLSASHSHIWWTCAHSLKRVYFAECFDSCRLVFKPGNLCHCRACSQPLLCPQTCLLGIRASPCTAASASTVTAGTAALVFSTDCDPSWVTVNTVIHAGRHEGDIFCWVLTWKLSAFKFVLMGICSECQYQVIEELSPREELITFASFFHTSARLSQP